MAPNFSVLAAPDDLAQAMEVKPEHVDAILALAVTHVRLRPARRRPRTIDTVAIQALDRAWRIFAVMQASLPDLRNASKLLDAFRSLGYARRQDGAHRQPLREERRHRRWSDVQRTLGGAGVSTRSPNSYKDVSASINHGDPLAQDLAIDAVARQLAEFAAALSPQQEDSRGLLGRLFQRA